MGYQHATRDMVAYLRIASPIILLLIFVASFIASSIVTARNANKNANAVHTGPGGRPLPKRSRSTMTVIRAPQKFSERTKLLFKWLSVGVLLTIAADGALNVAHVMIARSEHWWCGQSVVVSPLPRLSF